MSTTKSLKRIADALERMAAAYEQQAAVYPCRIGAPEDEDGTDASGDILDIPYPPSDPNLWDRTPGLQRFVHVEPEDGWVRIQ